MKFGPYSKADMEEITGVLVALGLPFKRWEDTQLCDRQWSDWRNHLPLAGDVALPFTPRGFFIELSDQVAQRTHGELSKFGIGTQRGGAGLGSAAKAYIKRSFFRLFLFATLITALLFTWSIVHPLLHLTLSGRPIPAAVTAPPR
jgi:hypothetical protein